MMRLPIAPVLLIALACAMVLLAGPGAEASPDVTITVNSNADIEDPDSVLTLREAMLLATGELSVGDLTEEECTQVSGTSYSPILGCRMDPVSQPPPPGPSSADTIVFDATVFPPANPETIALGSALPVLGTGDDTVDGSSAGVIVDGVDETFKCFKITSDDNTIKGLEIYNCWFGVDIYGGAQNTIGGSGAGERNVISGNRGIGVLIAGSGADGNSVKGNYIGTDASGTAAVPNTSVGVHISAGPQDNTIGGSSPGEGNVISGNGMHGVSIAQADGNSIKGNYIGTDASGTAAVPNEIDGVLIQYDAQNNTIGGSGPGEGNVISGNRGAGVGIAGMYTNGNSIKGNYIGTDASGTAAVPNDDGGVYVGVYVSYGAQNNTIGGSGPDEGNTIAFNRGYGVRVEGADATGDTISGNSIHSNGGKGIENIDGGNMELAPPIVDSAVGSASGHTSPKCYPCTVEVFSDYEDEGLIYHGSTTTNDDAAGSWTYDDTVLGPNVTATITDASGNTSEFSEPIAVAEPEPSPTPTPSPTPSATPSATPSPSATPGGTTLDIALVAGWNHVCYTGPEQPIADALAPLGDDVAAVYRLRPDQGYDRWFPDMPGSSITTVSPYQPLFLLMLDSALWTQHPATPPTSVGLVYGWNSACYLGQTKPPSDATAAIASQLAILYKLDSSHGWGHYMPDRPGDSTIAQLERYAAVFMLVTASSGATWAFDQ